MVVMGGVPPGYFGVWSREGIGMRPDLWLSGDADSWVKSKGPAGAGL
jgi:hypothetical protein